MKQALLRLSAGPCVLSFYLSCKGPASAELSAKLLYMRPSLIPEARSP